MLFEFSDGITEYIEEKSFQIDVIPAENRLIEYPHITVSVKSLSEYMRMVAFLYEYDNFPNGKLAFRGVEDYTYSLSPSLKVYQDRSDFSFDYDDNIENRLVDEMLTSRPEEFDGITSDFDLLAKMQHLGLPTRLLDFSLNPLVALYFACQSLSNTTARVICTRDTSSAYSRETVEKVCGTYKAPELVQFYLENLVDSDRGIQRYWLDLLEPLMAHPKCISERIRRQSGIFMIFPNTIVDNAWFNIVNRDEGCYYAAYNTLRGKEILNEIKILEDPYEIYDINPTQDLLGYRFSVTSDTVYRMKRFYQVKSGILDMEKLERNIKENAAWIFEKRFEVNADIAPIPQKIMADNFCSILVEPQYKKAIIRELEQVNINEAFLFPEPEYTAKRVKNRYLR